MARGRIRNWIAKLARNDDGNVTMVMGLVAAPLIAVAGLAIDYGRITEARSAVQQVADGAALAAATAKGTDGARTAIAQAFIKRNLPSLPGVKITPNVSVNGKNVSIVMNTIVDGTLLAVAFPTRVSSAASDSLALPSVAFNVDSGAFAEKSKAGTRCLIALNSSAANAIYIRGTGDFTADECEVHANSSASSAIHRQGNAGAEASRFTANGGYQNTGNSGWISPAPETSQGVVADPYMISPSDPGGSAATATIKKQNGNVTLSDVKYSNITIQAQGTASFSPGVHYITGTLSLGSQATLTGTDVTLVLLGSNAKIDASSGSTIRIQAPTNGTYPGFALVGDKDAATVQTNTVQGGAGSYFRGIVYTPRHKLYITGNGDFNAESTYSPMIVDTIEIGGNGTFSIGMEYEENGYPKPQPLDYTVNGKARLTN